MYTNTELLELTQAWQIIYLEHLMWMKLMINDSSLVFTAISYGVDSMFIYMCVCVKTEDKLNTRKLGYIFSWCLWFPVEAFQSNQ